MARGQSTGNLRADFVPTIASMIAPTVAELTAGTALGPFMPRDGLDTPQEGETADNSDITSRYNKTSRGNYGGQPITLTLFRDEVAADDDAWTALPRGTSGYVVVRRFGGSTTAWAASQKVEVFAIEVISRAMAPPAANENQRFVATCAVPQEPVDGTVAA